VLVTLENRGQRRLGGDGHLRLGLRRDTLGPEPASSPHGYRLVDHLDNGRRQEHLDMPFGWRVVDIEVRVRVLGRVGIGVRVRIAIAVRVAIRVAIRIGVGVCIDIDICIEVDIAVRVRVRVGVAIQRGVTFVGVLIPVALAPGTE
jgi:hypothetical protein